MKNLLINLINFYQTYLSFDRGVLSIFAPGGACKYPMSCSEYSKQAIIKYGLIRGGWMGLTRIWSCR
ncbi:membrane protein insertion efficiency factor YidD [Candidatus Microgenomates bacterium]|nr:membrane protein insertion efficiency factor YidD [Candidatus Microgenomates bacterium]